MKGRREESEEERKDRKEERIYLYSNMFLNVKVTLKKIT